MISKSCSLALHKYITKTRCYVFICIVSNKMCP